MYLGNYGSINTNYIDSNFSLTNSEINLSLTSSEISLIYVSGLTLSSSICSNNII